MVRSCPVRGLRGRTGLVPRDQGCTQGQGYTYNPHSIKGHLGMELRDHVLPPVKGLRVGEIGEGCGSRPDLKSPRGENRSHADPAPRRCQASALGRAAASCLANADTHQQTSSPATNKPLPQCLEPWRASALGQQGPSLHTKSWGRGSMDPGHWKKLRQPHWSLLIGHNPSLPFP